MDEKIFKVKGSADEPYEVTIVKRNDINLTAYCTCPAGQNGLHCKHRIGILTGKTKKIVSDNLSDVEVVASWLPGTDVEAMLNQLIRLEAEFEKTKAALSNAKKELARALHD